MQVTGQNLALSEQQLIDCDRAREVVLCSSASARQGLTQANAEPYFDLGCQGGDFNGGFQFVIDNGVDTEADYV